MEKATKAGMSDWVFGEIDLEVDEDGNVLPGDLDEETVEELFEDPEFLAWLDDRIAEAENDPRPSLSSEEMWAHFEKIFAEARMQQR